jgi:hypothetical protein
MSERTAVAGDRTQELPVLIAQTGKLHGSRWVLEGEQTLIGRGAECDLVIPDRQVSRTHARILHTPEGYTIEDLGSKNGTHVNGVEVDGRVQLQDGDIIQIALAMKLIFVGTESTIPLRPTGVSTLDLGRLRMDPQAHRVWVDQAELDPPLSPPQYRMLDLLYRNPGRVVSREEIVEQVWPEAQGLGVSEQAIDALVRRLRDRLAEVDPRHNYIVTVRGHGFRLDNSP